LSIGDVKKAGVTRFNMRQDMQKKRRHCGYNEYKGNNGCNGSVFMTAIAKKKAMTEIQATTRKI